MQHSTPQASNQIDYDAHKPAELAADEFYKNGHGKQTAPGISDAPTPAQHQLVFNPQRVISQATDAAKALQKVLDSKPRPVVINGERYLEFEDWQTLGSFYGITAGSVNTQEIHRNGKLLGFNAQAIALQKGKQVSAAEACCLRDEARWAKKPEFELRSMAQTRACAKALRNVLGRVAVLAGYSPTPATAMSAPSSASNQPNSCPHCGSQGKYHAKDCPNFVPQNKN